jgi:hypothetical protein
VGRYLQTGQWWAGISTGTSFTNHLWDTWNPAATWVDVQVGDLNGDGKADLIARYLQAGQWWAALSNGSGFTNMLWDTWAPDGPGLTWVDVHLADVNGDGKADLIGRIRENGQWWVGLSAGNMASGNTLFTTWSPAVAWANVHVGDFSGDGQADVAGQDPASGRWWVSLSTGTAFQGATTWDAWPTTVSDVPAGYF